MRYAVVPTAAKPITAAATARMVSKGLLTGTATDGAMGRGAAAAGRGAAAIGAAAPARGAAGTAAGAAAEAVGAGAAPAPGPPGGSVGSLMVGAAEGFGGKLMRTVSFLGWTLPVSFLGGTAPAGMFGILSAINQVNLKLKSALNRVKPLFHVAS